MLEWYDRVWSQCDDNAISELMHPDCVVHGIGVPINGPDDFKNFHHSFLQAFSKPNVEVIEMIETEEVSIGHAIFRAKHLKAETDIEFQFSFSVKWKDGKAVEGRNVVDFTSVLTQIGVLEPNVFVESLLATPA